MKNKETKENSEDRIVRRLGMVMEQIRSEVRVVAEGHGILHRKFESLENKVDEMNDNLGKRIDRAEIDLGKRIDRVESMVGNVLKNHEGRIAKIEDKIAV